jgi:hypothetical protein
MSTESDDTNTIFFPGFDIPRQNWFKMPNNWTDITAAIGSIAELKVVEYVLKHTWGYQEYGVRKRITNDEFMHGRRRKDGTRIDKGTGLSKPSVIAGLKAAVEKGLLIEEVDDSDKARVKKYYCLRMVPGLQNGVETDNEPPSEPGREVEGGGVKDLNAGVKDLYPEVKNLYPWGKDSLPRSEQDTLVRHSKQNKKRNNNNKNSQRLPDVVVVLRSYGISERVAQKLASEYPPEQILEKIEFLAFLQEDEPEKVKNPQGWLRKAIQEGYAAPSGYRSAAEREIEAAEARRQAAEIARAIEAQDQRDEERRERYRQEAATRQAYFQEKYGTTQGDVDLWRDVLEEFKVSVPAATFQAYVANTLLLSIKDSEALIGLSNPRARDWLENRFATKIQRTLASRREGQKVTVKFIDLTLADLPLATEAQHIDRSPDSWLDDD